MQIRLHKTGGHHCAILKEEEGGNEEQKYDGQSFIWERSMSFWNFEVLTYTRSPASNPVVVLVVLRMSSIPCFIGMK